MKSCFLKKILKPYPPSLNFNQIQVKRMSTQKHLGLILDEKLNFKDHLRVTLDKANRGIGILQKLRHYIPRQSLVTLYKSFIRSYLDFADVIYDQPTNK